jgi:hypothetical protein
MYFVTVPTKNGNEERNVSLAYSAKYNEVTLLGNLEHNTSILVDQKLADEIQHLVDLVSKKQEMPLENPQEDWSKEALLMGIKMRDQVISDRNSHVQDLQLRIMELEGIISAARIALSPHRG